MYHSNIKKISFPPLIYTHKAPERPWMSPLVIKTTPMEKTGAPMTLNFLNIQTKINVMHLQAPRFGGVSFESGLPLQPSNLPLDSRFGGNFF